MKQPAYESIDPDDRVPSIQDPNPGITLWEPGAIIEYLVFKCHKGHKISFEPNCTEPYHARQWLHYQGSGQGPYFGRAVWFKMYHSERLQSAYDRYVGEIRRASGVFRVC
jgi:glutathione S-transferase